MCVYVCIFANASFLNVIFFCLKSNKTNKQKKTT